jgi:hypothetical protein
MKLMKKVFVYGILYFNIFHNYFIMYDIKYFILNKNNQTIQVGEKQNFMGGQIIKVLMKNTIFQNPEETCTPGSTWVRPWQ